MLEGGLTQQQAANEMGWSREKVKLYGSLNRIDSEVWILIGTVFQNVVPIDQKDTVPTNGTTVPFTENLLRPIICLTPDQQFDLVSELISNDINKAKFKRKITPTTTPNK